MDLPAQNTPPIYPNTDPRKSILPWLGALGHRAFLIDPTSDTLYGGWRSFCEAPAVKDLMDLYRPGMRIFEKVSKPGRYGAVREEYIERTPGLERWPNTPEDAHKQEVCYICARKTERIGDSKKFKTGFCDLHRGLSQDPARCCEWRNREMARAAVEEAERSARASLDELPIDGTEDVGPTNPRKRAQVRGAWTPYRATWQEVLKDVADLLAKLETKP